MPTDGGRRDNFFSYRRRRKRQKSSSLESQRVEKKSGEIFEKKKKIQIGDVTRHLMRDVRSEGEERDCVPAALAN